MASKKPNSRYLAKVLISRQRKLLKKSRKLESLLLKRIQHMISPKMLKILGKHGIFRTKTRGLRKTNIVLTPKILKKRQKVAKLLVKFFETNHLQCIKIMEDKDLLIYLSDKMMELLRVIVEQKTLLFWEEFRRVQKAQAKSLERTPRLNVKERNNSPKPSFKMELKDIQFRCISKMLGDSVKI